MGRAASPRAPTGPAIAVIGAGLSGSLLALHLLRAGPPDLTLLLVERRAGFGRGLAYGIDQPNHLLNVRAGNMSAFPDRPDHAVEWFAASAHCGPVDPGSFVSRSAYGRYIASLIQREVSRPEAARRLILAHDEAVALRPSEGGLTLELAMGNCHRVDAAVIATGNLPPAPHAGLGLESLEAGVYCDDPWAAATLADLEPTAPVMLLGAGLTMIDVAIALAARGHRGTITAISRRGLLPQAHEAAPQHPAGAVAPPAGPLSGMLRWARRRAATVGWRRMVDDLRPVTQTLWRCADQPTRQRFLRHLRPWWDIHRHRMAPCIAERIAQMRARGALAVEAGRVLGATPGQPGALVAWRPRGGAAGRVSRVDRIIDCTGPGAGPALLREPLIRQLAEEGLARLDPLELGLEVDDACRLIGRDGRPATRLYAVGPLTRGCFWETVAVPDIRNQVAGLAAELAHVSATPRQHAFDPS